MDLTRHAHRKDEHLSLAEKFYQPVAASQFDQLRFVHQSLPEMALVTWTCEPSWTADATRA